MTKLADGSFGNNEYTFCEAEREDKQKITMEQNKKDLLMEQANKIQEVIDVLANQFGGDFEDELNYLAIAKDNIEKAVKK